MAVEEVDVVDFIRLTPEQIKKVKSAAEDVSGIMQQIKDKQSNIKDTKNYIKEETGMSVKTFSKICSTYHKQNYSEVIHEDEVFQTLYENVFKEEVNEED